MHDTDPLQATIKKGIPVELFNNLEAQQQRIPEYSGTVLEKGIVNSQDAEGNDEAIVALTLMGSTLVGISRRISGIDDYNKKATLEGMRVFVIPTGDNEKGTSNTLLSVTPDQLRSPRPRGHVQPWEDIEIQRAGIEEATGVNDLIMSGKHAFVRLYDDGGYTIKDSSSTNGTRVFTERDLFALNTPLIELADTLRHNTHLWQEQSAGRTVIDPKQ